MNLKFVGENHELLLELFEKLFYQSPVGLSLIDTEGGYLEMNQSFVELLGYDSKKELLSKKFAEITYHEDLNIDKDLTEQVFAGEIPYFEIEKRFVRKDKQIIWARLHASVVRNNEGTPLYGIGILERINDRKSYEQQLVNKTLELAKVSMDLDQFIYRASHDLRSPVSNILALTNVVSQRDGDDNPYMELIAKFGLKMDGIIHEITDYAKNREFAVSRDKIDVEKKVTRVFLNISSKKSTDRTISLVKKIKCRSVYTDKLRLRIIIEKLLANAINFSNDSDHSEIEFGAATVKGQLVIKVKDYGIGIPLEIQDKIFEMFYRGNQKSEGAGLGLFVVKEMLRELQGEITLESIVGVGTEFTVKVPIMK